MRQLTDTKIPKDYMSMSDGTPRGGLYDSCRSQLYNHVKKYGNLSSKVLGEQQPIILYYHPVTGITRTQRPSNSYGQAFRMCVLEKFWDRKYNKFVRVYESRRLKVVPISSARPSEPSLVQQLADAKHTILVLKAQLWDQYQQARQG